MNLTCVYCQTAQFRGHWRERNSYDQSTAVTASGGQASHWHRPPPRRLGPQALPLPLKCQEEPLQCSSHHRGKLPGVIAWLRCTLGLLQGAAVPNTLNGLRKEWCSKENESQNCPFHFVRAPKMSRWKNVDCLGTLNPISPVSTALTIGWLSPAALSFFFANWEHDACFLWGEIPAIMNPLSTHVITFISFSASLIQELHQPNEDFIYTHTHMYVCI